MKIIVTGANGYIGRHVISCLKNRNHEILALDNRFDEKLDGITYEISNIFEDDLSEKIKWCDGLIHLAYRDGFKHMSNAHLEDLYKHITFIQKVCENGLKQLIVLGTMHEVGYHEGAIDENTACAPLTYYGIAKNTLRQVSKIICEQNNTIWQWVRAYYITGDETRGNSIFAKITQAVKEGKTTFPLNSGKNLYDFIDIDELAYQIVSVIEQKEIIGIINCCSGKPISLLDKITSFIKEKKYDIKLDIGAFPDRPYDSPGVWGDNTKINKIIRGDH